MDFVRVGYFIPNGHPPSCGYPGEGEWTTTHVESHVATNKARNNLIAILVISGFAWCPEVHSQPVINIRLWKRLSAQ